MNKLLGSSLALLFLLCAAMPAEAAFPRPPQIVTELDGDPLAIPRRIVYPNGTLSDQGGGIFNLLLASSGDVAANTAQLLTVAIDTTAAQVEIDLNTAGVVANSSQLLIVAIDTTALGGIVAQIQLDTAAIQIEVDLNTTGVTANAALLVTVGIDTAALNVRITASEAQLLIVAIDTTSLGVTLTQVQIDTAAVQAALDAHTLVTSAHGATPLNTADLIVRRDSSGDFAAGTITAALTGAASSNVLKAGDTMTGQLTISGSTLTVTGDALSVGISTFQIAGGFVGIRTAPVPNVALTIESVGFPNNVHALVIKNLNIGDVGLDIQRNAGGTLHIGEDTGGIDWIIRGHQFPIYFIVQNENSSAKKTAFEFTQSQRAVGSRLILLNLMAGQTGDAILVTDSAGVAVASITATGAGDFSALLVNSEVAFSSVPVMHISAGNSTLGAGTTFYSTPSLDSAMTLRGVAVTVVVAGIGGSGDQFCCSDGTNETCVTSPAASVAGTTTEALGLVNVPKGNQIKMRMESDAGTTPTVNLSCAYSMQ